MKRILPILLTFFLASPHLHSQIAGNALHFDGTDDYIDCLLPSVFDDISSNDFTIEVWMTPTLGSFQRVVFAQLNADNFASISLTSTGEVIFYLRQNNLNFSVQSVDLLNSSGLVHVAVVWNASALESKIFINGNEATYASGNFVSSTGLDGKMALGAKTDGAQVYTGSMDEISIWSVAKTACEVSFEMNDKKQGTEPNLEAYYSFDQGIAEGANPGVDELDDQTSANYDGTLMGFALSGNTSNWVTSLVEMFRFWGDQSSVLVGQLGLVATVNASQYQWIYCDDLTPVPGANSATFDPPTEDPNYTGTTDFYAVVSSQGNCVDTSGCFNANGEGLSVNELDASSAISVYPNPSAGFFTLESALHVDRCEIRDLAGKLIEAIVPTQSNVVSFDLSEKSGVYLITVYTQSGIHVERVVVSNL